MSRDSDRALRSIALMLPVSFTPQSYHRFIFPRLPSSAALARRREAPASCDRRSAEYELFLNPEQ